MIYIEIIIATAFVLFLLSSLVSGINELWALLLNKRGREMRRALQQAFPELNDEMMRSLYNHPLIAPLKEKPKGDSIRGIALKIINFFRFRKFNHDFLPSYLDSKLFSRALADILVLGSDFNDTSASYGDEIRQLYTTIESLDETNYQLFEDMYLNSPLGNETSKEIWSKLNTTTSKDFAHVKSEILSGLRKEMSAGTKLDPEQQGEALLSRFLVHTGTEQPTTTDFLARHSTGLNSWLDNTSKWFDGYMDRVTGWYKKRSQTNIFWWSLVIVVVFNINIFEFASELYMDHSLREIWVERAVELAEATDVQKEMEDAVTPLTEILKPQWPTEIPKNLPGWLVTVFAISLGAPFWFDILSKAVNLRAAGKKKAVDT